LDANVRLVALAQFVPVNEACEPKGMNPNVPVTDAA